MAFFGFLTVILYEVKVANCKVYIKKREGENKNLQSIENIRKWM